MLTRPRKLKPFLLILSHKKSKFREKQFEYLKNHLKKNNFYWYYFIGNPNIEKDYIIDEYNKIVYLKVPDNYESLSLKVYYSFRFIYNNFSTKIHGIFKTDDDITLNLESIFKLYEENFQTDYFGNINKTKLEFSTYHIGKCENEILNKIDMPTPIDTEYCSGGGYYVNVKHLYNLLSEFKNFNKIIFEDVCVGYTLKQFGIFPTFFDIKKNGFLW